MRTDWKPAKPYRASRDEWTTISMHVMERDGDGCLLCGRTPVTRHHVIPRSLGGSDVPANIVFLCGHGTTGCHGLVEARDAAVCVGLGEILHEDVLAYVAATKGEGFLERYYGC